jgi:glycosyltransferase involved in cell wall biosynthesis
VISLVVISKDEPALDATLTALAAQGRAARVPFELLVIDASARRLDAVRRRHPAVRWIEFAAPPGVRISIPHQRNAGVRAAAGDVVVFTDAGCRPRPAWLPALLSPITEGGETIVSGRTIPRGRSVYGARSTPPDDAVYLPECPTGNLAFRREAFDAVGGFDESFEYGSDIDFSWRLVDAGYRIRNAPGAVIEVDWGDDRRQVRRAFSYGRARARLYLRHPRRIRAAWRQDPVPFVYPAFLLGLPVTVVWPLYPGLLVIPAVRNRREDPLRTLVDHLVFATGVLAEVVRR